MKKRDYYEVLGISRDAQESEIKRAYRRLAMKFHPDRNPDDASAESRFKEAKEAYEVLSSPEARARYDRFGHEGLSGMESNFSGASGFGDIFSDLFSDIFDTGRNSRGQANGDPLHVAIDLDLEEAVRGVDKEIRVNRTVQCSECYGKGMKRGSDLATCTTCNGRGQIRVQQPGFMFSQTCPQCKGNGKVIKEPCEACNGGGQTMDYSRLSVSIPAGIDGGNQIRITGKGHAARSPGGRPGDLYVRVNLRDHSIFERDGDNIFCEVPISFTTAALGGNVEIPTLEGRANLKVSPETQTGKIMRLRGKGVRNIRSRALGDLYCKLIVETPVNLTAKQKNILRDLERRLKQGGSRHTPRAGKWTQRIRSFWERLAA